MFHITPVVKHLLIINLVVYFGSHIVLPEVSVLYLYYPQSEFFKPYQIVTHMFMHGSLPHLMFNMLALLFLGPYVEAHISPRRFISYYLICGFGAMALYMLIRYIELTSLSPLEMQLLMKNPFHAVVGASGAIYGVLVGFAVLFPNARLMLLFPPIPVKAKYLAIILVGLDLAFGLSGVRTGIAHFAHIGGALFGFILLLMWGYVRLGRR